MGVVYAAYDPQLDRRIALKVLKGDGFDPTRSSRGQAQLVREAQAMARLSHTNVVTVHDVGTVSNQNMVFVAMEFIEGIGLRQWWEAQTRSWREILDVFIQAGEGLAAAHDAGLVHRDFKPDNVLVGDDGRVVVTDFGLARRMETGGLRDPDEDSTFAASPIPATADHGTLGQAGTPAYMPPETHLGRHPSAAGDQFSFALTLYEALYGEHPFYGTDPVSLATSVMDDKRRVPREDIRLPTKIRRAIDRALSHDPDRRWPSMHPFLAQLAATRRPRGAVWVATGLGLCAVGMAMVTTSDPRPCEGAREHLEGVWDEDEARATERAFEGTHTTFADASWRSVRTELDEYAEQWVSTRTAACEATARGEQSQELLDLRMQCLDSRRESLRQLVSVLQAADATVVGQARRAVDGLPPLEPCSDPELLRQTHPPPSAVQQPLVEAANARLSRTEALFNAGLLHSAREAADGAVKKAEESGYPPAQARAFLEAGTVAAALGDVERAEQRLRAALGAARESGDEAIELQAWLQLVYVVGVPAGRPEEAERWYPVIEALLQRVDASDGLRATFESTRGALAQAAGRPGEAATRFERALSMRQDDDAPDQARLAGDYARLAAALVQQGRYEEAGLACEQAMERQETVYGISHPRLVSTTRSCAAMELERGNVVTSRALFMRARELAMATFGERHATTAELTSRLGVVERVAGDLESSRRLHVRALQLLDDPKSTTAIEIRLELALSLLESGHPEDAEAELSRIRRDLEELDRVPGSLRTRLLLVRGRTRAALGLLDEAAADLDSAIDRLGTGHPTQLEARARLADVELRRGRTIDAQRQVEHAVSMLDRVQPPATVRARVRFTQARVAYAIDGTGREAASEALALFTAQPQTGATEAKTVASWLTEADPR
jgi:tetratricopeptide (TPR) repeat protein